MFAVSDTSSPSHCLNLFSSIRCPCISFYTWDVSWFYTSCLLGLIGWLMSEAASFSHPPACTSCSTGCTSANVFNSLYCPRFFRSLLWFPVTLLLKVLEGKLKYGTPSVSPPHRQKRGGTSNGFLKLSKGQCCSHREISRMPIIYSSRKTPTIHCTRGKGLAVVWKK